MKTWKQSVFFGILAVTAFGFAFVGCGDKTGPCNCDTIAHLGIGEKCGCGGSGCNCTEQIAWLGGIKIRKMAGITVEEMDNAFIIIESAVNAAGGVGNLSELSEIHLTIFFDFVSYTNGIASIGLNIYDSFLDNFFYIIASGDIKDGFEYFSSRITITLDKDYSVKVESSDLFTSSEWSQALLDIKSGIETGYNKPELTTLDKNVYHDTLGHPNGVYIIIERNPEYPNWKKYGGGILYLYLKYGSLKNLSSFITEAVLAMGVETAG